MPAAGSVTVGFRVRVIGNRVIDSRETLRLLDADPQVEHLATQIIAAAIDVHRELGPGYLESVYHRAMSVELSHRRLAHVVEHPVRVSYRGVDVGEGRVDLLVERVLICELKAVDKIAPVHKAQVLSYLKALDLRLGLLVNFNVPVLKNGLQRVIRSG